MQNIKAALEEMPFFFFLSLLQYRKRNKKKRRLDKVTSKLTVWLAAYLRGVILRNPHLIHPSATTREKRHPSNMSTCNKEKRRKSGFYPELLLVELVLRRRVTGISFPFRDNRMSVRVRMSSRRRSRSEGKPRQSTLERSKRRISPTPKSIKNFDQIHGQ
jgi:hypothetical protein